MRLRRLREEVDNGGQRDLQAAVGPTAVFESQSCCRENGASLLGPRNLVSMTHKLGGDAYNPRTNAGENLQAVEATEVLSRAFGGFVVICA